MHMQGLGIDERQTIDAVAQRYVLVGRLLYIVDVSIEAVQRTPVASSTPTKTIEHNVQTEPQQGGDRTVHQSAAVYAVQASSYTDWRGAAVLDSDR